MPLGEIPPGSLGWLRWGFVGAYGVLVVIAIGYAVYRVYCEPQNPEFSAIPLILLGLPWSVLIVRVVSEWSSSTPVIVGGIALGIGLNGILLFLFGVVLSTFVRNVKRIL
jgi:hypothetical protein